jgi:hypothetical protein
VAHYYLSICFAPEIQNPPPQINSTGCEYLRNYKDVLPVGGGAARVAGRQGELPSAIETGNKKSMWGNLGTKGEFS